MLYNPPSSLKRKGSSGQLASASTFQPMQRRGSSNSPKRLQAQPSPTKRLADTRTASAMARWGYEQPAAPLSSSRHSAFSSSAPNDQQNASFAHSVQSGAAMYYPPGGKPSGGGPEYPHYSTLQTGSYVGTTMTDYAQAAFRSRTIDFGNSPRPTAHPSRTSSVPSRSENTFGSYFSPIAGSMNPSGLLEIIADEPMSTKQAAQQSSSFTQQQQPPSYLSSIVSPPSTKLMSGHASTYNSPAPSTLNYPAAATKKGATNSTTGTTERNLYFSPVSDMRSLRESIANQQQLTMQPNNSSMSDGNISAMTPKTLQSSYDSGGGGPFSHNYNSEGFNVFDEVAKRNIHHGRVLSNYSVVSAATASQDNNASLSVSPASLSPSSSPRRRGNSQLHGITQAQHIQALKSIGAIPFDVSVSSMASEDFINLLNSDGELVSPAQLTLPAVQSVLTTSDSSVARHQRQQPQAVVAAKERRSNSVDLRAQHAAAIKQRKNAAKQEKSKVTTGSASNPADLAKPLNVTAIAEQSAAVIGAMDRAFEADLKSTFKGSILSQQQLATQYMSAQQQAAASALLAPTNISASAAMSAGPASPKVATKISNLPPPPISEPQSAPQRAALDLEGRYFPSIASSTLSYLKGTASQQKASSPKKAKHIITKVSSPPGSKKTMASSAPQNGSFSNAEDPAAAAVDSSDDSVIETGAAGSSTWFEADETAPEGKSPVAGRQRQQRGPTPSQRQPPKAGAYNQTASSGGIGIRKSNRELQKAQVQSSGSFTSGSLAILTSTLGPSGIGKQVGAQAARSSGKPAAAKRPSSSTRTRSQTPINPRRISPPVATADVTVAVSTLPQAEIDLGGGRKAFISIASGQLAETIADRFIAENGMDSATLKGPLLEFLNFTDASMAAAKLLKKRAASTGAARSASSGREHARSLVPRVANLEAPRTRREREQKDTERAEAGAHSNVKQENPSASADSTHKPQINERSKALVDEMRRRSLNKDRSGEYSEEGHGLATQLSARFGSKSIFDADMLDKIMMPREAKQNKTSSSPPRTEYHPDEALQTPRTSTGGETAAKEEKADKGMAGEGGNNNVGLLQHQPQHLAKAALPVHLRLHPTIPSLSEATASTRLNASRGGSRSQSANRGSQPTTGMTLASPGRRMHTNAMEAQRRREELARQHRASQEAAEEAMFIGRPSITKAGVRASSKVSRASSTATARPSTSKVTPQQRGVGFERTPSGTSQSRGSTPTSIAEKKRPTNTHVVPMVQRIDSESSSSLRRTPSAERKDNNRDATRGPLSDDDDGAADNKTPKTRTRWHAKQYASTSGSSAQSPLSPRYGSQTVPCSPAHVPVAASMNKATTPRGRKGTRSSNATPESAVKPSASAAMSKAAADHSAKKAHVDPSADSLAARLHRTREQAKERLAELRAYRDRIDPSTGRKLFHPSIN